MTPPQALLVVVNAAAGSTQADQVEAAMASLRSVADAEGRDVETARTRDLDHLAEVLAGLGTRRLVVLGGDGSLQAVLQILRDGGRLGSTGPIGLVPLGTGNDLARSIGLPADPAQAARLALTGAEQEMGLLVADDGTVVVNAVHVGVGVAAAMHADRLKPHLGRLGMGRLAYPTGALVAGVTGRGWRLRVCVDGAVVTQPAGRRLLMVALGLGATVGGGAPVAPGADPRDTSVDVVVSESVGPLARLGYARHLAAGSHLRRGDVRRARGRVVELSAAPGESFFEDGDGEVRGPFTTRRWQIEPAAWRVVGPTGAAARRR